MEKLKILWLNKKVLSERETTTSGTWLDTMARGLVQSGEVELGNISAELAGTGARQDCGTINQWVVSSSSKLKHDGLPASSIVQRVVEIANEFSPDLIHVWGTERFLGLLTARNLIKPPALLETQGLKFAIAKVFHGGLSAREQLACVGVKEILTRSAIFQEKGRFAKWGSFEKEIISQHRYVAVQTEWGESQVRAVNRTCTIFQSSRRLRDPFYRSQPWVFSGRPVIFCSAAYSAPFKGLHVAVRAVAILKNIFPNIRLRIAGAQPRTGIRRDGYDAWLIREIKLLGVNSNVEWLGALNANGIVDEMNAASAVLIPTYIENCCNAMQEAMMVGTPVVATFTGGLPSLANHEDSALFFPIGDEAMCARQLERVLTEREFAMRLSKKAREIGTTRNDPEDVVRHQLHIYRQVIAESKTEQK
jgi:glycosyltransferase involved in cell wall biosynthesis